MAHLSISIHIKHIGRTMTVKPCLFFCKTTCVSYPFQEYGRSRSLHLDSELAWIGDAS